MIQVLKKLMKLRTAQQIGLTLILLATIVLFSTCSGKRLQTVADETDANEILDILREHGIEATKTQIGEGEKIVYEIHLNGDPTEYGAAIQLMEDHCLPQPMPPKVESSGIVSSLEVEKAKDLRRRKISIESLLRSLPGVTCVDLTIVPPEDRSLSLNPYKSTASVTVRHKTPKFGISVDQIGRMVAGGVPGLTADNVFVTLTQQPLRPLPNLDRGRTIRRIFYVSGIGLTTILLFVGLAIFLRKRKEKDLNELQDDELTDGEDNLLEEGGNGFESALIENADAPSETTAIEEKTGGDKTEE